MSADEILAILRNAGWPYEHAWNAIVDLIHNPDHEVTVWRVISPWKPYQQVAIKWGPREMFSVTPTDPWYRQ